MFVNEVIFHPLNKGKVDLVRLKTEYTLKQALDYKEMLDMNQMLIDAYHADSDLQQKREQRIKGYGG